MECAGNVTLFKKGDIRIQFWHTGGRVRSITEYGNVSHRANRRYIHYLVTFTLILLEGAVLAMDHYKESYAISQDKKASRLSESISLSDLSHSMPHDCVIEFWESRLLDPIEREKYWAKSKLASDGCIRCLSLRNLRNCRPCIGRKADYGARRISNDHSIEAHETP
jgi:hypothetical protein